MNKCYSNVKAFMLLGQPDMVSGELRPPYPGEGVEGPGRVAISNMSDVAEQMVEASKDLRSVGKPHPTRLGLALMLEELGETIQAAEQGDLAEFADGLADLVYVTVWTALAHGIDLPAIWDEVQRSNMEKFPECAKCGENGWIYDRERETILECPTCSGLGRVVIRDPSGKIQKPSGWTPPDIKGVLARQRSS